MSWNYRILKKHNIEFDTDFYGLYEVYYDEDGFANGCTETPMELDGYEDADSLISALEIMLKDANRHIDEILNYEDF